MRWGVEANAVLRGLVALPHRPKTWGDYVEAAIQLRRDVLRSLADVTQEVRRHFQSREGRDLLEESGARAVA